MSEAQVYTHTIQSGSNRENCEAPGRSILLTDNLWRGAGIALVVVLWQLGVNLGWINSFLMGLAGRHRGRGLATVAVGSASG